LNNAGSTLKTIGYESTVFLIVKVLKTGLLTTVIGNIKFSVSTV
jgi:hypothetical protein